MAKLQRDFERLAEATGGVLRLIAVTSQAQTPMLHPPPQIGEAFLEIDAAGDSRMIVQDELRPRLRDWWPVGLEVM